MSSVSSTTGSSVITALNAGSGVDTGTLITSLVSASYDPKSAALKTREAANTAKISALGTLSASIDSFSSALGTLISSGTLFSQPTTSNDKVLTATAKAGAQVGNLSAQLIVKQVAQAQSLVSGYYANPGAAVGTGRMTLTVGGKDYALAIDSPNNTLAGIARAVNAANSGVTASVVTDANGSRLTFKGATGAANNFTLTAGSDADAGLQALAYPGSGMTKAQDAQDAIVRMDGVDVTRATNTIDDLVDGVTLKLVSAAPTETVTLGGERPTAAIKQGVADFVAAYNELKGQLDGALSATGTANEDGSTGPGALYGNSGIRQMQVQLARLTSTVLNSGGGPQTLAEIGVSTNRDGTLSLNDDVLARALATSPDGVEAMFNPTQHASSSLIKITSAMGAAKPGTYQLTNIKAGTDTTAGSGIIAGVAGVTTGTRLYAATLSKAAGLVIEASGDVASATVTVDLGLGGALKAIRDQLQATGGVFATLKSQFGAETSTLAAERTKIEQDQSDYKDRLTTQFSAMNSHVSAFKATQEYLKQQIAAWNKSDD